MIHATELTFILFTLLVFCVGSYFGISITKKENTKKSLKFKEVCDEITNTTPIKDDRCKRIMPYGERCERKAFYNGLCNSCNDARFGY